MSDFYFAKGVVNYKKDGWVVIQCPDSIADYYSFWVRKFTGKKVSTSYWNSHLTVVPAKHEGDLTKNPLWGKHQGEIVEFKYYSQILTDHKWFFLGTYFWLRVECSMVNQIRVELGLKPNLKWPIHLTVAHRGY